MRPTIESGATVSHYRVIAPLGAGGMGEVYKAHDNTLERTVALKILPPHLVRNDERVRRFMQEARSASSLNHPHIVTIHEIGEAHVSSSAGDGEDGTPIHYIAMELIDGVTLKRKIHDERTDLRTVLTYLAQAAEGLAKAHAAGIVHRDLKPENIMVTHDGFAKVLDFGLAKLNVKKTVSEGVTQATAVRDDTREGALLGTVAYMSPEQVQGKVADHRSDIFAFGAILYEAATRQRPFQADSDVDVMHKILHDKPTPVDEIAPNVPGELRRMIRRCLAKEPERRFQSMKDIALELAEIVDEFDQLSLASATQTSSVSGPVLPQRPTRTTWIVAGVVGALALAAIAFSVMQWRASRATAPVPVAFGSMKIAPLTSSGKIDGAAISPDGKYVAHITRDGGHFILAVRHVATGSDIQVLPPGSTPFMGLSFSPDGNYLYYARRESAEGPGYATLFQVPALGGTPRKLLFDVDTSPAFSPDAKQIAFGRGFPDKSENHLVVANADGTSERKIASFPRFLSPARPAWSPDGKKLVTPVVDATGGWHVDLVEVDLASGTRRKIGKTVWFEIIDPTFLADGSALLLTATDSEAGRSQLWLQPYPEGTPVRVTNDLQDYVHATVTADGGVIAAVQEQRDTEVKVGEVGDESGGTVLAPTPNQRVWDLDVARTGAVVYRYSSGSAANVGIIDATGAAPRPLTDDNVSFDPSISADGKTIVFASEIAGPPHLYAVDADGSNRRQITRGAGEIAPTLSDDGRTLVYRSGLDTSLWTMPLAGGAPRKITDKANGSGVISPDGVHVAYLEWRREGERSVSHLVVVPLAGGAPLLDVPWTASGDLRWHPNGKDLTYRRSVDGTAQIFAQPVQGGEPRQLTRLKGGFINGYDWLPDGKLVMARGTTRSDVVLISNFRAGSR
jgi:serine/threonine protein kinase/Tol biopolymer transport system component